MLAGGPVTHHGAVYRFSDVELEPRPSHTIPLYYCGNTPLSARRAIADCDGWLPGRLGIATLERRVATIRELAEAEGRPMLTVGIVPPTISPRGREDALALANVDGLVAWANKARFWVKPSSGRFEGLEGLGGVLVAGDPQDEREQRATLDEAGADLVVFDFRLAFDRWLERIEMLAESVPPVLSATASPRGAPPT